jgi:hypothetical protein
MLRRIACENMLITCSAFCLEMWDVIWKMRFKFVLYKNCLKWFILVIMFDHLIVNFFNSSSFIFDEWRMLILDYRMTYVCSRSVERRLWWNVKFNEAFIKFDENDSSNLTKHLIKFDENDSSNLTKATHQTWWKRRHLIKLDESVISSNLRSSSHQTFWKERRFLYFLMSDTISCNNAWYKELSLAKNHFYFARR